MNTETLETAFAAVKMFAESHPRPSQVTQAQAAEMLGVSPPTIVRLLRSGALHLNACGRIPISEIDKALEVRKNK